MSQHSFRGLLIDKKPYNDKSLIINVLSSDNIVFSGFIARNKSTTNLVRLAVYDFVCLQAPGKDFVTWQKAENVSGLSLGNLDPRFLDQYYLIAEICRNIVNEGLVDEGFYSYFTGCLTYFSGDFHPEFHLSFLVGLISVFGLHPDLGGEGKYFDLREAHCVSFMPSHPDFVLSEAIRPFLYFTNEFSNKMYFRNAKERHDFMIFILRFIHLHRGLNLNLKSLEVLRDIRD